MASDGSTFSADEVVDGGKLEAGARARGISSGRASSFSSAAEVSTMVGAALRERRGFAGASTDTAMGSATSGSASGSGGVENVSIGAAATSGTGSPWVTIVSGVSPPSMRAGGSSFGFRDRFRGVGSGGSRPASPPDTASSASKGSVATIASSRGESSMFGSLAMRSICRRCRSRARA